jgi:hypothetical protein
VVKNITIGAIDLEGTDWIHLRYRYLGSQGFGLYHKDYRRMGHYIRCSQQELLVSDGSNGFTYGMRTVLQHEETSLFRHGAIPIRYAPVAVQDNRLEFDAASGTLLANIWKQNVLLYRIDPGRDKSSRCTTCRCMQVDPECQPVSMYRYRNSKRNLGDWKILAPRVSNSTLGVVNVIV